MLAQVQNRSKAQRLNNLPNLFPELPGYYDQEGDPYDAGLRQRSLPLFTHGLSPKLRKSIGEIADGVLAHVDTNSNVYPEIHFMSNSVRGNTGAWNIWQILMAAYDFTGNGKHLKPIPGSMEKTPKFIRNTLVKRYSERIRDFF